MLWNLQNSVINQNSVLSIHNYYEKKIYEEEFLLIYKEDVIAILLF